MSAEQSDKLHNGGSAAPSRINSTVKSLSTETTIKPRPSQQGTARLASIAPRPSLGAVALQKPSKVIAKPQRRQKTKEKRRPSNAVVSTRIPSAPAKATASSAAGVAKGNNIPSAAIGGMSTALTSTSASASASAFLAGAAGSNSFSFDAEDNLIQELLAGIPSTAWLPTDPLTSEGWFTDPTSSVITQDRVFANADFQCTNAEPQQAVATTAEIADSLAAHAADHSATPASARKGSLPAAKPSTNAPAGGSVNACGGLSNASDAQQISNTPDSRLIAALRSKRENGLMKRGNGSQKANPLFGFAKKHGVGYPVGNQMMAYLSPALLSSSPPNAKQLRTNPYKYYSPPKPTHRAGAPSSVKGRNLMLGTPTPCAASAAKATTARNPAAMPKPVVAADSGAETVPKTPNAATKARAGAGAKGIKWEIAQDKQLLKGVREQRWINGGGSPRDPSKFSSNDWESIARGVAGAGVERTSRQCRRRWAVMHAHLGSAIMDFVDSTLTPQSSAQSTPSRGKESAALNTNAADEISIESAKINNPKLANLPMSSPPFMPAFARLRESDAEDHRVAVALSSPQLNPDEGQLAVVRSSPKQQIALESVNMAQRWQSPAYCQLLADVVQALSNPHSQAADIVRKYTAPAQVAKTVSDKNKDFTSISLPEVSLSAVVSVAVPESTLATSDAGMTTAHSVLPTSTGSVAVAESVDGARKPPVGDTSHLGLSAAAPELAMAHMPSLAADLEIGVADPDWNMYNQFLQSLGSTQVDLGGDWANIFADSTAGIGIGQGISESAASFASSSMPAGLSASTAAVAGILTVQPEGANLPGAGTAKSRVGATTSGIDDDDANDDDFVLDDLEEGDDEEDDDDDDDENDADVDVDVDDADDADDAEDNGDNGDDDHNDSRESSAETRGVAFSAADKHAINHPVTAHAAGSSGTESELPWDLTLDQLGFDLGASSVLGPISASALEAATLAAKVGAANAADIARMDGHGSGGSANNVTFAPDPLIQQLLRGAADISNSNSAGAGAGASGKADGSGKGAFPNAAQSAWLSNALDSAMLPQWNSSDSPSGALSLSASGSTKTPSGKGSGKRGSISGGAGSRSVGKTPRQGSRVSGQSTSGAAAESGSAQRPSAHPVQLQQLLLGDIGTPSRRNSLKSARKRLKKKSASASIAKALSAAAMIDMDGLMSTDSNVMDTEMTGLYQDALQEGEELDVQEESLMADNSEYLFSSDQMRELRDQQIQNFQIVTQALLVSCAEVGPHAQRTRHWKQQLDQLALWHLLGTRESPSDLVSSEGLCHFATLIDSAEKVCEQSGSTAMTEMGRFAPNPTSFFAIPGITAVIPDLYEAIDEIHRATQLSVAEHETKAFGGGGSSGSTEIKTIAASDGAVPAPPGQSSSLTAGASASVATGAGGSGLSVASSKVPEVRAFNGSMGFTTRCQCTPANGFKSAMMVQCVFPLLYLQMRNGADGSSGKRKASEVIEAADGRHYPSVASGVSGGGIGGGSSKKQQAVAPLSEDSATAAATATLSAGDGSSGLLQPAGVKPLKPLVKPISRQLSGSLLKGREASCGAGLPAIMPLISMENLPSYTAGDVRAVVDEMRAQVRAFKRDLHRVARSRRRIFVQGDDGVPRLEWMQVKIEPLTLPLAMQCLLAPLIEHSGFRESMMPKIVVVRKPKNRIHFLDTEDTLLLKGLRLFGLEDVASIRVHLMPCKTASQLRNRINNLRARRAEANPIKDFCLRRIMPFTLEEEEVLRLGVIVYGDEFNELNQNFLVNRPILALSHVWNHMRNSETSG